LKAILVPSALIFFQFCSSTTDSLELRIGLPDLGSKSIILAANTLLSITYLTALALISSVISQIGMNPY